MKLSPLLAPCLALALTPLPQSDAEPVPPSQEGRVGRIVIRAEVREGLHEEAADYVQRRLSYLAMNHGDAVLASAHGSMGRRLRVVVWTLEFPEGYSAGDFYQRVLEEEGWAALMDEQEQYFELASDSWQLWAPTSAPRLGAATNPFRWTRTLQASYGNFGAALLHVRALAEHVNASTDHTHAEVFSTLQGGHEGQIHLVADFRSWAQWQQVRSQLWMDEAFLEKLATAAGRFEDDVWDDSLLVQL